MKGFPKYPGLFCLNNTGCPYAAKIAMEMKMRKGDAKIKPVEARNRSNNLFEIGMPAGKRIINPRYSG